MRMLRRSYQCIACGMMVNCSLSTSEERSMTAETFSIRPSFTHHSQPQAALRKVVEECH
jgi:hypothetical protein